MWPCWNRCGLDGESVSLAIEFGFSKSQFRSSVSLLLLSVDPNLALSATMLPVCCQAPHHDNNEIKSEIISRSILNALF